MAITWLYSGLGTAFAIVALYFWVRALRLRRLLQDLPTSKTRGVFIGLVELKGTAEIEAPLTSYLAETVCVQYSWNVSEHWQRIVTYTETDKDGNTTTKTRIESGWISVASGGDASLFYLQDDTGTILIRPNGANIEGASVFSQNVTTLSPLYYGKGPGGSIPDSTGQRMFTETAIPLHAPIFIIGRARQREDIVAPEIAASPDAPLYLISTRTEDQVANGHGWIIWLTGFLILCLPGGGWAIDRNQQGTMLPADYLPAGWFMLGSLDMILLAWLYQVFNSMTELRNRVRQAESLVDIELKRRNDLIPELVRVVEAARAHEADVNLELAHLRAEASAEQLSGITGDVRAIAEAYPNLMANEIFLKLQQELADTEQRIAMARDYRNDTVTYANTRTERFPEGLIAWLAGLKQKSLLVTDGIERAAVKVNLAD